MSGAARRLASWLLSIVAILAVGAGCRAGGCAAGVLGDVVGATGDAHCDRRFVSDAQHDRAPFCQEIIDTVADSQFEDDCREKHGAAAGAGRCGFEHKIAGCKLDKKNDDGSEVWDWYYDVSDLEAELGPRSGPDGGPTFDTPPRTKDDVRRLCADRSRYEDGAEYRDPESP